MQSDYIFSGFAGDWRVVLRLRCPGSSAFIRSLHLGLNHRIDNPVGKRIRERFGILETTRQSPRKRRDIVRTAWRHAEDDEMFIPLHAKDRVSSNSIERNSLSGKSTCTMWNDRATVLASGSGDYVVR